MAAEFGCLVEHGVHPHPEVRKNDGEGTAVQGWTTFAPVSPRRGNGRAETLAVRLTETLTPSAA
ncbi:hypothetical protein [Deinococcus planocerae]|uniref:hypothetical protein n=1 Tax=Deinococcus planocerae TaxID=1737569 RepID=UPI001FE86FF7|nr:hypothetical protein [Deinococcus planocerae]